MYAETAEAWCLAPQVGNPKFYGYTIEGSWVISGEGRPYDPNVGFARRVIPKSKGGAWELGVQFSRDDFNNAGVEGGDMGLGWVGVNWWQTPYWKYSIGYGTTGLTQNDTFGQLHRVQMRVQWVR
ncbi:MAG: hypothetical protein JO293_07890 [Candidatus Eremiobacteraeota bacterium]|nr:hypothetical protein [Candidatus Eremiobacteraeota bacterium]